MARNKKKKAVLPNVEKADPKIRVIANGSDIVNALRSERTAALRVTDRGLLREVELKREPLDRPDPASKVGPVHTVRGEIDALPERFKANVYVRLQDARRKVPEKLAKHACGRHQDLVAATVTMQQLGEILREPEVAGVELAQRVSFSPPLSVRPVPRKAMRRGFDPSHGRSRFHTRGKSKKSRVLIGIIDVQGFDFAHPDFLDAKTGKTRFISIWDQGGDTREAPDKTGTFNYGAELTSLHMNDAIAASKTLGLPATTIEPQSQMAVSAHATHVASIAGGNHGICPDALLAGVLFHLPGEDEDRRMSFYDSTRIAHAVDYLFQLGEREGVPVSINISLGTNGHAHDGTSGVSRWLDYALITPGRCVSVAAGNAGQHAPAEPGDWGYMVGRIHTSGCFAASGLTRDIQWIVMGDGIADLSENELEIWYAPQDRFTVTLRPPGETNWIGPLSPGEFVENRVLKDGTFVSIYNERYHAANGSNHIAIYLSPLLSTKGVVGVRAGTWTVRLTGEEVRDGRYHGWIERDDPRLLGRAGTKEAWCFPSFFSQHSNVDESSVSSLACGQLVLSVANVDEKQEGVNITSSQGPTRDGREKPEIAAPGTDIVAANGFDPKTPWVSMTGTSMASPFVAGVTASMLQMDPSLTAAQIGAILRRTAQPLSGSDYNWKDDAGYGVIRPGSCLDEVRHFRRRKDRT